MNDEERALRDAFLAECWKTCREVPREERADKRKADRLEQWKLSELDAEPVHNPSPDRPHQAHRVSTGCAENGGENVPPAFPNGASAVGESTCRQEVDPERNDRLRLSRPGPRQLAGAD